MTKQDCPRCEGDGLEMCRVDQCDKDKKRKCKECHGTGINRREAAMILEPNDLLTHWNVNLAFSKKQAKIVSQTWKLMKETLPGHDLIIEDVISMACDEFLISKFRR